MDLFDLILAKKMFGGGGGVTSWNDLTDKPFYEEGGMVEVPAVGEWSVFDEEDTDGDGVVETFYWFLFSSPLGLTVGNTYIVNWDGTEYTCVAQDASALSPGAVFLGNGESANLPGNDEPFGIVEYADDNMIALLGGYGSAQAADGSGNIPFSIYGDNTVIKPIDGKFLPKGTPWIEKGEMVEILPDYTINSEADMAGIPRLGLVAGNTYIVKMQGTEYTCVAWATTFEGIAVVGLGDLYTFSEGAMGTAATGEPFILMEVPPEAAAEIGINVMVEPLVEMAFPIVFSIYQGCQTIHKLDNRCLDLAWLPTVTKEYVEYIPEYTTDTGRNFEKFMDIPSLVGGKKYRVTFDGVEYVREAKDYAEGTDDLVMVGVGNIRGGFPNSSAADTGEPFLIWEQYVVSEGKSGIFFYVVDYRVPHTVHVEVMDEIPNKLPAEFLPDDATSFTLVSPNGTKYAVTVSDDGTLSATAL